MERLFTVHTPKHGTLNSVESQQDEKTKELQMELELLSIQIAALNKRVAQLKQVYCQELNAQTEERLMTLYDQDFSFSS